MIIDSSAIVELFLRHEEADRVAQALELAPVCGVGAPTLAETALVLRTRLGFDPAPAIQMFLADYVIEVIAFRAAHWQEASRAFARFGKGRHPARLNFGDCLSYAVARLADRPLLFVGDDFADTDIVAA